MNTTVPIGETLHRLLHSYRRALQRGYAENHIDLTVSHIRVLKSIAQLPDVTAQHIAECMRQDKARIARLTHDLEIAALIERQPHPVDSRSRRLVLTVDGQALFERIEIIERRAGTRMAAGISERELHRFNDIAESMIANLEKDRTNS